MNNKTDILIDYIFNIENLSNEIQGVLKKWNHALREEYQSEK